MKKSITDLLPATLAALLLNGPVWAACTPPGNIGVTKPDSIYTDNFDGTVTDTETGLTWSKCSLGQSWVDNSANDGSDDQCSASAGTYTWKAALEAAQAANAASFLGQADWRLPDTNELETLVDSACITPAINASLFPSTVANYYWTSSPHASGSSGAWGVSFSSGNVSGGNKGSAFRVRLVRGGQ